MRLHMRTSFITLLKREIMRFMVVPTQTIASPIITALLYIIVFGSFLGPRIGQVGGTSYILFFIPGLALMSAITSSYSNSSFSVYFMRLIGFVEDILIAPLTALELTLAFTLSSIARGLLIMSLVYAVALLFTSVTILHPLLLIYFAFFSTAIFALLGIITGLFSEQFEHVNFIPIFLITPLTLIGGVFHSIAMLPESLRALSFANPFFYMINGFRFATIGIAEADILASAIAIFVITVALFAVTYYLIRRGWKLKS